LGSGIARRIGHTWGSLRTVQDRRDTVQDRRDREHTNDGARVLDGAVGQRAALEQRQGAPSTRVVIGGAAGHDPTQRVGERRAAAVRVRADPLIEDVGDPLDLA
jgi:hypothetical protein